MYPSAFMAEWISAPSRSNWSVTFRSQSSSTRRRRAMRSQPSTSPTHRQANQAATPKAATAGTARYRSWLPAEPPYEDWDRHERPLAELVPTVLADDGLVVVETAEHLEPALPLALVTTRRYGSARITVFSR